MESLKNLRIRMAPWIDEDYRFQYGDVSITLEDAGLAEGPGGGSLEDGSRAFPAVSLMTED